MIVFEVVVVVFVFVMMMVVVVIMMVVVMIMCMVVFVFVVVEEFWFDGEDVVEVEGIVVEYVGDWDRTVLCSVQFGIRVDGADACFGFV